MHQQGGDAGPQQHQQQPEPGSGGSRIKVGEAGHRTAHQRPVEAVDAIAPRLAIGADRPGKEMGRHDAEQGEPRGPERLQRHRQQQQQSAERIVDEDHLAAAAQPTHQDVDQGVMAPQAGDAGQGAAAGQQPLEARGGDRLRRQEALQQLVGDQRRRTGGHGESRAEIRQRQGSSGTRAPGLP